MAARGLAMLAFIAAAQGGQSLVSSHGRRTQTEFTPCAERPDTVYLTFDNSIIVRSNLGGQVPPPRLSGSRGKKLPASYHFYRRGARAGGGGGRG